MDGLDDEGMQKSRKPKGLYLHLQVFKNPKGADEHRILNMLIAYEIRGLPISRMKL